MKFVIIFLIFVFGVLEFYAKTITVSKDGKSNFQTIQAAINSIDDDNEKVTIKVKGGVYREQIFIAKNNIHLQGDNAPIKKRAWKDYTSDNGVIIIYGVARDIVRCRQSDDWGASVVNVRAKDITLQNLVVVNDYGFTNNTNKYIECNGQTKEVRFDSHQFALRCMPPTQRFQALSCNFHSRGGDTVSPWDVEHGTFYFKDCTMEGGVDFYCPRGWAYAEKCFFICHNLNAAIWHDGTGTQSAKSVIKNSQFVGDEGFKLGRYHRPAQIYLLDCKFSIDMADADIYQVNKDSVVEWGKRIYYYNAQKEGGDFNWHKNNISKSDAKKINKDWVLKDKWNPSVTVYRGPTSNNAVIDSVAERMLLAQTDIGGWAKTLDSKTQPVPYNEVWGKDFIQNLAIRKTNNWATIDNNATNKEIKYLAEAYEKTKNDRYRQAAERGLRYLLKMQKQNGGFPQFYPDTSGYRNHITYNDNAMVNCLKTLYEVSRGVSPFTMVGSDLKTEAGVTVNAGIACLLATQISYKNIKTVWCAQHDANTLLPAKARAYEHPSFASNESAGILSFLMSIDNPTNEVKESIKRGMLFLDKLKIKDQTIERIQDDWKVVKTDYNPNPSWARFYSLEDMQPIFSGRDGVIKSSVMEIEEERRKGYAWYGTWPKSLLANYPKWVAKYVKPDLSHVNNISDTTYNFNAAYLDVKKTYPEISIPLAIDSKKYLVSKVNYIFQDRSIDMHIVSPIGNSNGASIMILHGGGWRTGNPAMHMTLAQNLAALGYQCFLPAYTLSSHALYPQSVLDVVKAQSWIDEYQRANNIIVNKKIIMGFSAGAQLASLVAQNPTIQGQKIADYTYNGLINLDGIMAYIHPISGEGDDVFKTSAGTKWFGYNVLEKPSLWLEASPLTHAGNHSPPTLFLNSSVDRMHAGRDEYLHILRKNNKIGEYHTYPSPHSFVFFNPWFDDIVKRIHDFIGRL